MKNHNKWAKCFVVQVKDGETWINKTLPVTELQAIRLMIQTPILRRYHDQNNARIAKLG